MDSRPTVLQRVSARGVAGSCDVAAQMDIKKLTPSCEISREEEGMGDGV